LRTYVGYKKKNGRVSGQPTKIGAKVHHALCDARDGNADQHQRVNQKTIPTHMELGKRVTRARIVSLADIGGSVRVSPELGGASVASQLGHGGTTGGEVEEAARCGRMIQVTVLIAGRVIIGTGSI